MFPVSDHTAEKVQHDINAILNAIAQWLSKIKLELPKAKPEAELPPVQWNAELEQESVIDLEVLPELQTLSGYDLERLEGNSPFLLAPVQFQIGTTQIAGFLPEIREQLEQLPPEQIAAFRQAIQQPTGTKESGEAVDIQVEGVTVLHRNERGQMEVNELQPLLETDLSQAKEAKNVAYLGAPNQRTIEVQTISREFIADHPEYPHVKLRPVAEVEALTGQQTGDSSTIHDQVIQQAPSILMTVDDQGHVKPGSYLREPVEATEDEVEASTETDQRQTLIPEAIAVVERLKTHFAKTGSQELICSDYTFRSEGDRLHVIPNDNPEQVVTIQGDRIHPAVRSEQYQELMQRFTSAYEQIQVCPGEEDYEYSDEYELE